jgi:hypothetical protein
MLFMLIHVQMFKYEVFLSAFFMAQVYIAREHRFLTN